MCGHSHCGCSQDPSCHGGSSPCCPGGLKEVPMALEPTHVTVAGTGAVYVAPEGTVLPSGLAVPTTPWEDVGFVGEDGVSFTFSRDQEEINAWQSADPVRVLITNEPK